MQYQEHFGKKFYLDKEKGYWISTTYPRIRAHVWVWQQHYGKPPKGFHIHHKDENKSNNTIENLELMTVFDHLKMHGLKPDQRKRAALWCSAIRHLTKKWHASPEGIEWHRKHGLETWKNRNSFKVKCNYCGKEAETKTYHQTFCSNACKSSYRRKSGIDDIERKCLNCKKEYTVNKYAKRKFCSRKCSSSRDKN